MPGSTVRVACTAGSKAGSSERRSAVTFRTTLHRWRTDTRGCHPSTSYTVNRPSVATARPGTRGGSAVGCTNHRTPSSRKADGSGLRITAAL